MASAVEFKIEATLKSVATIDAAFKKVSGEAGKHLKEFETINSALYEGTDLIAEVDKKLNAEKDPQKQQELKSEKAAAETTLKKMTEKLKTIVVNLKADATNVGQLVNSAKVVQTTVVALNNEAKRAAMDDAKKAQENLKKLAAIGSLAEKIGLLKDSLTTLPKTAVKI